MVEDTDTNIAKFEAVTADTVRPHFAIDCTNASIHPGVEEMVQASLSLNTQRAYLSDLAQFEAWGGTIPASTGMMASYLAAHAGTLSVATLQRRLASISKAHAARQLTSPTSSELVRATMRGIRRTRGVAQKEARPLLREDLFAVLDCMGASIRDTRDRALLLIGFAGGFRRSELVGLDIADIELVRQGMIVTIRRSKTDQNGSGRKIGIPHGRTRHCPVQAFECWLAMAGTQAGPVFRPINRHSTLAAERLSGEAVSLIIQERIALAGLKAEGYSGHSLRAGFATSAAMAGTSAWKIREQTGHASDAMLARYVRNGELFTGNAAGALL